jgi:hypothetical protein
MSNDSPARVVTEITVRRFSDGRYHYRAHGCPHEDWSGLADSRQEAWEEACRLEARLQGLSCRKCQEEREEAMRR